MTRFWEQAKPGRHRIHLRGPTKIPDRIRRASAQPLPGGGGEAFGPLLTTYSADLSQVFGTTGPVLIFPGSGTTTHRHVEKSKCPSTALPPACPTASG
jgi:aspartate aminotransferase-like enzyme